MRPPALPPRSFAVLLLSSSLLLAPVAAASEVPLTLDEVVSTVRAKHPALAAARARIEAAGARVAREGAWEDPMAGINIMRVGTTDPFDPETVEWMFEQKLPLSGRNRLAARVAESETSGARAAFAMREVGLVAEARAAFFEYAASHRRIELNHENQDLVREFIAIARSRFEVGREPQSTVLLGETELARLEEEALGLASELASTRARLNTLMARPIDSGVGRPGLTEALIALPGLAQLEQAAARNSPALQTADAEIETGHARLALARRNTFADPALRIEARMRNGGGRVINDYDTALVVNLPWFNPRRTRSERSAAECEVRAAEAERDAVRLELIGALREQWERLAAQHGQIVLTRDRLLPLAHQAIAATRVAYENGRASFLELVTAQRAATEIEADYIRSIAGYHAGLARLEQLTGGF